MKKYKDTILAIAIVLAGIIIAVNAIGIFIKIFIPVMVVFIVFKFLFSSKKQSDSQNVKKSTAIFSGSELDFCGEKFSGGKFLALFGGVECILRNALIEEDVVINATAIFGGIDITVPEGVNVKVNSNSIFGGVSQKQNKTTENTNTLYINATCLFGGVDIK